jgi:DNA-binding MarR family transcriptional regulator
MNKHSFNTGFDRLPLDVVSRDSAGSDPLALDNQICFAVYAASLAIKHTYRPFLDELGLTYAQYLVLMVLWTDNNLTVAGIGRRLHVDSGTLSPLLKRLESIGLVNRRRRVEDERKVEISLTEAGQQMRGNALSMKRAVVSQLDQTVEQVTALRATLKAMAATLSAKDDAAAVRRIRKEKRRKAAAIVV